MADTPLFSWTLLHNYHWWDGAGKTDDPEHKAINIY